MTQTMPEAVPAAAETPGWWSRRPWLRMSWAAWQSRCLDAVAADASVPAVVTVRIPLA